MWGSVVNIEKSLQFPRTMPRDVHLALAWQRAPEGISQ
jgi:hypothetical protein